MQKHTIVVCDHIHEAGLEMLQNDENINYVFAADMDKKELIETVIPTADVAITKVQLMLMSFLYQMQKI